MFFSPQQFEDHAHHILSHRFDEIGIRKILNQIRNTSNLETHLDLKRPRPNVYYTKFGMDLATLIYLDNLKQK
jgi:hypothetical protein